MNPQKAYLQGQVNASNPGTLLVMLYDGLIRFSSEAKAALSNKEGDHYEEAANAVKRATDILTELSATLNHEAFPELCQNLGRLYTFFTDQLSTALKNGDPNLIDGILPMIEKLRDSWKQAEEIVAAGGGNPPPTTA